MRKFTLLSIILVFVSCSLTAQQQYRKAVKPTKNMILMIPDGTSNGLISATRWYKTYLDRKDRNLAIDPYICGTVQTFNSNAPIGDSAPTTSCYVTGYTQQAGSVSTYSPIDPIHDIFPMNASMAYQPLTTLLEAARLEQNKSTGVVVNVEFSHATPADCAAHHYSRYQFDILSSHMAYNQLDVVIGSGTRLLTNDIKERLNKTNTELIVDDLDAFKKYDGKSKLWALFEEKNFPFEIDRDTTKIPSLAQMTETAISKLSQNDNGFFLMVEGSQVDYAAHSNDAAACLAEYMAFDEAVQKAIDFAIKDGETTVVVLTDHANSGFTIGARHFKNYTKRGLNDIFDPITKITSSARNLETILLKEKPENFKKVIKQYMDMDVTEEELALLFQSKNYKEGDYMQVNNSVNLISSLVAIANSRLFFGFTTGGHTGDEVILAVYHPDGQSPAGFNTNQELHQYMYDAMGLTKPLDEITKERFAKHTDVFAGMQFSIDQPKEKGEHPSLIVKKGKNKLVIPAHKSVALVNGKEVELGSVVVYIDKNDTFYLPTSVRNLLK